MRMSEDVTSKAPHGFDHIVVVGLGLIGASLAAAISKSDPDVEVFGVDVDSRTCGEAISRGWVANACAPESEAFSDFVKDRADLVVLATPGCCGRRLPAPSARLGLPRRYNRHAFHKGAYPCGDG